VSRFRWATIRLLEWTEVGNDEQRKEKGGGAKKKRKATVKERIESRKRT
jgi:hypothetical protein